MLFVGIILVDLFATLDKLPKFTEEEDSKFSRRYEEGYDLKGDKRYNLWLSTYHAK